MVAREPSQPGTQTPGGRTLVLLADGRELDRVIKDRFLIGRGKHCDLIINSGKVSREHAAITREGSTWFIEDLGSSNGTWYDKRRISRRQIQEGDEYFICSEKLGCTFR
jgi:pSer/pThr/pTyr-binding forkhead associated (FHA) protein